MLGPDGGVKHRANVTGTVSHGEIRYVYTRGDIVLDGGFQPCRYAGAITRTRLKLIWELLEGNATGVIIMKPTAQE